MCVQWLQYETINMDFCCCWSYFGCRLGLVAELSSNPQAKRKTNQSLRPDGDSLALDDFSGGFDAVALSDTPEEEV